MPESSPKLTYQSWPFQGSFFPPAFLVPSPEVPDVVDEPGPSEVLPAVVHEVAEEGR